MRANGNGSVLGELGELALAFHRNDSQCTDKIRIDKRSTCVASYHPKQNRPSKEKEKKRIIAANEITYSISHSFIPP